MFKIFKQIFAPRNKDLRKRMIIQSKCGICNGYYDSSKEHIIDETLKSIKRLNCDYLDILLLHRPDALVEYEEVNEAFNYLYEKGLVKNFGVSNMNPLQIELYNKYLDHMTHQEALSFGPQEIILNEFDAGNLYLQYTFDESAKAQFQSIKPGQMYNIIWDGVAYKSIATPLTPNDTWMTLTFGSTLLGLIRANTEDTEVLFAVLSTSSTTGEPETHTFEIYSEEQYILNSNALPATLSTIANITAAA